MSLANEGGSGGVEFGGCSDLAAILATLDFGVASPVSDMDTANLGVVFEIMGGYLRCTDCGLSVGLDSSAQSAEMGFGRGGLMCPA